jgi:hypothetical protein
VPQTFRRFHIAQIRVELHEDPEAYPAEGLHMMSLLRSFLGVQLPHTKRVRLLLDYRLLPIGVVNTDPWQRDRVYRLQMILCNSLVDYIKTLPTPATQSLGAVEHNDAFCDSFGITEAYVACPIFDTLGKIWGPAIMLNKDRKSWIWNGEKHERMVKELAADSATKRLVEWGYSRYRSRDRKSRFSGPVVVRWGREVNFWE